MPDPIQGQQNNQSAQGQGQSQPQGQAQGQPGGGQVQDPKWLSFITDEALRKEAREGWMKEEDYRKKTMELSDQRKAWETEKQKIEEDGKQHKQYADWYNQQYVPWRQWYEQNINANWDKIAPIISGQAQPANSNQQQPNQQLSNDPFNDYDLLPPKEQAKRLADFVHQNHVVQALKTQKDEFNQVIGQYVKYFQNYIKLLTDAFGRKVANPGFDIEAAMQEALKYQQGQFNPLDIVYTKMTAEADREKEKQQWLNKGKEERDLELKNQQQSPGALQQSYIPVFRQQPLTREQISEQVRNQAAQKGIAWTNPG